MTTPRRIRRIPIPRTGWHGVSGLRTKWTIRVSIITSSASRTTRKESRRGKRPRLRGQKRKVRLSTLSPAACRLPARLRAISKATPKKRWSHEDEKRHFPGSRDCSGPGSECRDDGCLRAGVYQRLSSHIAAFVPELSPAGTDRSVFDDEL